MSCVGLCSLGCLETSTCCGVVVCSLLLLLRWFVCSSVPLGRAPWMLCLDAVFGTIDCAVSCRVELCSLDALRVAVLRPEFGCSAVPRTTRYNTLPWPLALVESLQRTEFVGSQAF